MEKKVIERDLCKLLGSLVSLETFSIPISIREITLDSRFIKFGDLFIAVCGNQFDGRCFISQAIANGAVAVIAEAEGEAKNGEIRRSNGIPIIYLSQLLQQISNLAGNFYKHPSKQLKLVGVTGTNGKTTITHLIAQWVNLLGESSGIMGTMGHGIYNQLIQGNNTTDSAIKVQRTLHTFVEQSVKLAAMEVSSHGLEQYRVSALNFSAGVFTNLSHDHLDYHGDMISYELAKWQMFSNHKVRKIIVNGDDKVGQRWINKLPDPIVVTINKNLRWKKYSNQWLKVVYINYLHSHGTEIYFSSSWGDGKINSSLMGIMNISNLLLALTTLLALDYPLKLLLATASQLKSVRGRMEMINLPNKPWVIIDYAHTPDALKNALKASRLYCKGKLWCVFGCGGERDKGKRPLMGAIAEKFADMIIITDDNPRSENSNNIINDILMGFIEPKKANVIRNRTYAITKAIIQAKVGDVILVAGKGHENYQIIQEQRIEHSDHVIIENLLGIKNSSQ